MNAVFAWGTMVLLFSLVLILTTFRAFYCTFKIVRRISL